MANLIKTHLRLENPRNNTNVHPQIFINCIDQTKSKYNCIEYDQLIWFEKDDKYVFKARNACCAGGIVSL